MEDFFQGKKILITGGTGTIGKSILRHLVAYQPKVIRIFSRDEYKQFELAQEYSEYKNIRYLIGDIRDSDRLKRAMEDIDIVFHCAAMKHVNSCEYNPFEAVLTNIMGTQNVIQAATEMNVRNVLFTSSDKAISPVNVYGASKLTAERLIAAAQGQRGPNAKTLFTAVRFGNVIGSRGSVIPLFVKQIRDNQEVTVTDFEMTRFMMTQNEAVKLIFAALRYSKGGEIFVLKMPVIRLGDLVEVVADLTCEKYGLTRADVRYREIGLRPGEKRYEELLTDEEAVKATEIEGMFVLPPTLNIKNLGETAKIAGAYHSGKEPTVSKNTLKLWFEQENII